MRIRDHLKTGCGNFFGLPLFSRNVWKKLNFKLRSAVVLFSNQLKCTWAYFIYSANIVLTHSSTKSSAKVQNVKKFSEILLLQFLPYRCTWKVTQVCKGIFPGKECKDTLFLKLVSLSILTLSLGTRTPFNSLLMCNELYNAISPASWTT